MCEQETQMKSRCLFKSGAYSLSQLIATLNNYACSLPPMANVDWFTSAECFLPTM